MNSIIRLNSIMLIGLMPIIICMALSVFFLDSYVIYGCTLFCIIIYALIKILKDPIQPNIIFIHSFISLAICSLIKLSTGNYLIPDKAVPLTLGIIIFCLSLFYITFPNVYKKIYPFTYYRISILNLMGCQIIVISIMVYILTACILYLFFSPLSLQHIYWLTVYLPITFCIMCILINAFTIHSVVSNYNNSPIVRVVAMRNGKILVSKRIMSSFECNKIDTPIEDFVFTSKNFDERVTRISRMSLGLYNNKIEPRFSIRYKSTYRKDKEIILYVLPLNDESDIRLKHVEFVSPDEIKENIEKYSSYMKDEIDHLSIAAHMWKEDIDYNAENK